MKRSLFYAAAAIAFTAGSAASAAKAAEVTVTISGIQPGVGDILIALQTEDEFLGQAGTYSLIVPADAETVSAVVEGVAPGSYAVAVVHDQNGDGTFEVGEHGPSEAWGLSGDSLGEPVFENVKVDVNEDAENAASVVLSYPM
ncbi:DUF2141 domain-containing protein [Acuticoccus yangtzensis]|uniref:DUF2141 domain-containing protein n=1 Tax=Acuticoccus yangtzensis TaxID=1443441 RepID=UPI0009494E66|nr:DUF2141 domain-containing protein [Acuticoccus yangtzensis]